MEPSSKFAITGGVGLFFAVLGCVMGWYGFPTIVDSMIETQMVLTNDSKSFAPWQEPTATIPVYMQFIMFNLTNGEEVKTGAKPVVEEVGPFSYREDRVRMNLTWSADNKQLTYYEVITYTFDPATSGEGVTEDTEITMINPVLVTVVAMRDTLPVPAFLVNNIINNNEKGASVVTYKAGEVLFAGVEDKLLTALMTLAPDALPPTFADGKFRLYPYNGTTDGPYTILTGKDDLDHFGFIQAYQNSSHLNYWNTPYCNMFNGTDGIIYPPHTDDVSRIYIFNKDLCRAIYLDYESPVEYFNIKGRRFVPTREVLEDPAINKDNQCFCVPAGNCLKAGVLSLSPCQYGAPIVASTPHFYNGAKEYQDAIVGMSPDKNRHETFIDIEPMTGLALNGGKKIQINLDVKSDKAILGLKNVQKMLYPLMYTNETARIDQKSADDFHHQLQLPLNLLTAAQWVMIGGGVLTVLVAILVFVRARARVTMV